MIFDCIAAHHIETPEKATLAEFGHLDHVQQHLISNTDKMH